MAKIENFLFYERKRKNLVKWVISEDGVSVKKKRRKKVMNRSDSYKDAVREAPPPRPPPPRRMASIDESGYAFNLVEYYLNERKNEYTSPRQV